MAETNAPEVERRRSLLTAALGFLQVEPNEPELQALHQWLDSWSGVGHIVTGMARQGYDLSLRKTHDDGWIASFSHHPMLSADGFAAAPTPWAAVQKAAWAVMKQQLA